MAVPAPSSCSVWPAALPHTPLPPEFPARVALCMPTVVSGVGLCLLSPLQRLRATGTRIWVSASYLAHDVLMNTQNAHRMHTGHAENTQGLEGEQGPLPLAGPGREEEPGRKGCGRCTCLAAKGADVGGGQGHRSGSPLLREDSGMADGLPRTEKDTGWLGLGAWGWEPSVVRQARSLPHPGTWVHTGQAGA